MFLILVLFMEKVFLSPEEIADLIPHWTTLDPEKLDKFHKLHTRRDSVRDRKTGTTLKQEILDVTPIICTRLSDRKIYILNGKHRALCGLKKTTTATCFYYKYS